MPGAGDALRRLAPHKDGVPLWWKVTNRNKRGITLDLRKADGKALLGRLIENYDVLVENFRTGTLDEWGITRAVAAGDQSAADHPARHRLRPDRPYRNNPGFARVFEAMSGLTRMCGEEGGTPLHLGYPISDAIGGLFGAIGVLAELYRLKSDPSLRGQEIDCSVTEAMMRTLDFLAIEYDQLGTVRTAKRQPQPVCRARQHLRDLGRQMGLDRGLHPKHLRALLPRARARPAHLRSAFHRQSGAGEELAARSTRSCARPSRSSRSMNCATCSMPTRSVSRRSTTPRTSSPTRISSRARHNRQRAGRGTRRCPHAMRGAALFGNAGLGAPRRAVAR